MYVKQEGAGGRAEIGRRSPSASHLLELALHFVDGVHCKEPAAQEQGD